MAIPRASQLVEQVVSLCRNLHLSLVDSLPHSLHRYQRVSLLDIHHHNLLVSQRVRQQAGLLIHLVVNPLHCLHLNLQEILSL